MTTVEQMTDETVLDLSRQSDELGVLSIYSDTRPGREPNLEGVAIELKNRYRSLQRQIAEDTSRGKEVSAALDRLRPTVERIADPTRTGRGHILFAALGRGWVLDLETPMAVPNRLVLAENPLIHPLLELLDEGQRAGVLVVSPQEARLFEWQLGRLRLLGRMEQEPVQAPHERAGQIGGGPPGQFHTPMREQHQARQRDRAERFLDQVVDAAVRLVDERGWRRIVVSGGERWTEPAALRFPDHLREAVIRDLRVMSGLDELALSTLVTERLHEERAAEQRQLVEYVRDAAYSQRAVLGLSEVTAALNMGRVAQLVYDPEARYTGSVGADGALYAGQEEAPGGSSSVPEPRLTDRLVERALATGARVSPVAGIAGDALEDAAGIAALLRW